MDDVRNCLFCTIDESNRRVRINQVADCGNEQRKTITAMTVVFSQGKTARVSEQLTFDEPLPVDIENGKLQHEVSKLVIAHFGRLCPWMTEGSFVVAPNVDKWRIGLRFLCMISALFVALSTYAAYETVDGVSWYYTSANGVATIGDGSFAAISTSTEGAVTIPSTLGGCPVTSIKSRALAGCAKLTSVTVPTNVTQIGDAAFSGCGGLESITLPFVGSQRGNSGVSSAIFGYIFGTSTYSGGISITQKYSSQGNSYYYIPSSLKSVTLTDESALGYGAFYNCTNLTGITLSNGVTNIGECAFYNCCGLSSFTIPQSVTRIGVAGFSGCSELTSITIPTNVTSIGGEAFSGCSGFTSITIPTSVTSMGSGVFSGCSGLKSITLPFVGSQRGNSGSSSAQFGYIFGQSSYSGGVAASQYFSSTQSQTYYIPSSLTSVVLTDETTLGYGAFYNCTKLKSITIPKRVTSIRDFAFRYCYALTGTTIPDGVTSISTNAFWNCGALKEVTIPQSVCAYPMKTMFVASYKSITNFVVTSNVRELSQGCFSGCVGMKSIVLPASITSVRDNSFENCSCLETVRFLGDAPDVGNDIYYGTPRSLTTHVPKDSKGWNGGVSSDLPNMWPLDDVTARTILYWDGPNENETAKPIIIPRNGTLFEGACEVSISCATDGATIYFTTNGTTPRLTGQCVYSGPFVVDDSVQIKAIAVAEGLDRSQSMEASLTKVDALTLPLAIGAGENVVTTDGDAVWFPIADYLAPDGGMAARSGAIGEDEESGIEMVVVGSGTLSFWWRVSCVEDLDGTATWDHLLFEADGKEVARIDGVTEWCRQEIVFRTAGQHIVRWAYIKDSYRDEGDFEDCAWVQGVKWSPESASDSDEALYTRDQIHALELGSLLIDVDTVSQTARLGIRLKETATLENPDWRDVVFSAADIDVGDDGALGISVPATGNAAFYKIVVDKNE